jgi:hypothetical protein
VFHHPAYSSFAAQVKAQGYLHEDGSMSFTTRMVQTVPEIISNLQSLTNQMGNQSVAQKQESIEIKTKISSVEDVIKETRDSMQH